MVTTKAHAVTGAFGAWLLKLAHMLYPVFTIPTSALTGPVRTAMGPGTDQNGPVSSIWNDWITSDAIRNDRIISRGSSIWLIQELNHVQMIEKQIEVKIEMQTEKHPISRETLNIGQYLA